MRITKILLFGFTVASFGQQPPASDATAVKAPAIEVKREPPAATVPPLLQQYDFGAQLKALQEGQPFTSPTEVNPVLAQPPKASTGQTSEPEAVPKDYRPRTDVPLTPTALEAVRVSERWRGENNAPAAGSDGRVLYSFGAGLPTVVCAPLRVCMIELQAGEKIVGEPHIGERVERARQIIGRADQWLRTVGGRAGDDTDGAPPPALVEQLHAACRTLAGDIQPRTAWPLSARSRVNDASISAASASSASPPWCR